MYGIFLRTHSFKLVYGVVLYMKFMY